MQIVLHILKFFGLFYFIFFMFYLSRKISKIEELINSRFSYLTVKITDLVLLHNEKKKEDRLNNCYDGLKKDTGADFLSKIDECRKKESKDFIFTGILSSTEFKIVEKIKTKLSEDGFEGFANQKDLLIFMFETWKRPLKLINIVNILCYSHNVLNMEYTQCRIKNKVYNLQDKIFIKNISSFLAWMQTKGYIQRTDVNQWAIK